MIVELVTPSGPMFVMAPSILAVVPCKREAKKVGNLSVVPNVDQSLVLCEEAIGAVTVNMHYADVLEAWVDALMIFHQLEAAPEESEEETIECE